MKKKKTKQETDELCKLYTVVYAQFLMIVSIKRSPESAVDLSITQARGWPDASYIQTNVTVLLLWASLNYCPLHCI